MSTEVLMPPIEEMGPKMRGLRDDRQRRFAWLMALGERSAAKAAREAGYSDVKEAAKVRAHALMHNQAVLDAVEECGRLALRGLAPLAIGAARVILSKPRHPAHARMIETVLDRAGFGPKAEVDVTHKHRVDFSELEDFARRLAAEAGIAPERLLGVNAPGPGIEGEAVETSNEPRA